MRSFVPLAVIFTIALVVATPVLANFIFRPPVLAINPDSKECGLWYNPQGDKQPGSGWQLTDNPIPADPRLAEERCKQLGYTYIEQVPSAATLKAQLRDVGIPAAIAVWAALVVLLWLAREGRGPLVKLPSKMWRGAVAGIIFGLGVFLWIVGASEATLGLATIFGILSLPVLILLPYYLVEPPLALIAAYLIVYWTAVGLLLGWLIGKLRHRKKR